MRMYDSKHPPAPFPAHTDPVVARPASTASTITLVPLEEDDDDDDDDDNEDDHDDDGDDDEADDDDVTIDTGQFKT